MLQIPTQPEPLLQKFALHFQPVFTVVLHPVQVPVEDALEGMVTATQFDVQV